MRQPNDASNSRGQAMVEFAIVLPILALLLVMALDFGRVFFGWIALQNGVRIAADFAAREATSWPADQDLYRDLVISDLVAINCAPPPALDANGNGQWDAADVPDPTFVDVDGNGPATDDGDHAVVSLDCEFSVMTPLASAIVGNRVTLGAQAYFAINQVLVPTVPTPAPPPPGPCPAPTALFTFREDPANGASATDGIGTGPTFVDFTDTSTADVDCAITVWEWDYQSDGTIDSSDASPQDVRFDPPGSTGPPTKTYAVKLTVKTADGLTSSFTRGIEVRRP